MNAQETLEGLKQLCASIPGEWKRTDGLKEFREDHAVGLSLKDIQESEGSDELKHLLKTGFQKSDGVMTFIITHHEATREKHGFFRYELGGQPEYGSRTGVELHVTHTLDEHVVDMDVTPSFS